MLKEKATSAKFKDTYDLETRLKMVANLEKKSKDCILAIIEKDDQCTKFPNLNSSMFLIGRDKTRISIQLQLRKKLNDLSEIPFDNQSIFMYTSKTILSKDDKFDHIYQKYKSKQDGILYLKYSSVEPF